MFTSTASVTIDRPISEVFPFVADARNRPSWDSSVDSEELTSAEPIGAGSTITTRMRSMGRDYEIGWEITEHEPPGLQRIRSTSGPFPTTLEWKLTEAGPGSTKVDFFLTGDPGGLMRLMQPLIARGAQGNLDRGFPRLKRLLETGSADPAGQGA
jgi:hypothetical protein